MHNYVLEKAVTADPPSLQNAIATIVKLKPGAGQTIFPKWEDISTMSVLAWVWRSFSPQVENTTER